MKLQSIFPSVERLSIPVMGASALLVGAFAIAVGISQNSRHLRQTYVT